MKACTRLAVPAVACALLTIFFLDRPDFLISSDWLLGAEFVWDVLHHGYAWSGFQQSRVPSFFPDFLIFGVVQAATESWRAALAIWVFVVIGWLVAVGSWITASIARSGRETATFSFLLLLMTVLIAAWLGFLRFVPVVDGDLSLSPYLFILMPIYHSGPFLVSLTTAAVAGRAAEQAATSEGAVFDTISVALLSWAATVSDQLSLVSLLVPLTVALVAGLSVGAVARLTAMRLLLAAWGGGAAGWACTQMLDRLPLPWPSRYEMEWAVLRFPTNLGHHASMLIVVGGLALALASDAWQRGPRGWLASYWSVFATASALGSLAVTILLYVDAWSYRYALPFLWWTVILVAAALARLSQQRPMLLRLPVATIIAGLALAYLATGLHVPRLFHWNWPLASCLQNAGLRAGLADYWSARKTSAASDWQLQVEQITSTGAAFLWANDRFWFTHDIHDKSRRPTYRFIAMDRLPERQITAVYGPPDHVMMCGSTAVWIYDNSNRLYHDLELASPSLADIFASAPAH